MDTKGGTQQGVGRGGVMNWEIEIDMYTLICIKWITNKHLLYKKINKIFKKFLKIKKKECRKHLYMCSQCYVTLFLKLFREKPTMFSTHPNKINTKESK